ncbi:nitric oxide synthase-related [Holotrichia oblita]|uniref:Nitric oxide synthase-related n=1 Tax=Holotrichia oblita TaxID=644536 RepID=A0ACB9SZY7_HOLOL|nr:nitric oxide synthase-related [Holotrichia oblita]
MAMSQDGFLKIIFNENIDQSERQRILPFGNSEIYEAKIKDVLKLTQGEDVKDIYDIALDTEGISYSFEPGDTIGILPSNDINEVIQIFECLESSELINKKCSIMLLEPKKNRLVSHLPVNTTLNDVFLRCVDIRTPPKKTFLKILMKYTENAEERSILEKLSSPSNSEDYIAFISNNGRRLLDLLQTFPSCKVPIEKLLENLPPLQPRPYSISSSPLLKGELHVTFSVEYFENSERKIKGVCTGWLENIINNLAEINEDYRVKFYFRKPNSFRLNSNNPIIMIGPGTGVAPFVGFLQHLSLEGRNLETWLFYGCRYQNKDYLYKNDLEKYLKENCLKKLSVAFSRDQDIKVYVQDLIKNETGQIYKKIVEENASVYVCGDLKDMMKDVKISIRYCLINNGMTADEADSFISDMIKMNKYVEDKWF